MLSHRTVLRRMAGGRPLFSEAGRDHTCQGAAQANLGAQKAGRPVQTCAGLPRRAAPRASLRKASWGDRAAAPRGSSGTPEAGVP